MECQKIISAIDNKIELRNFPKRQSKITNLQHITKTKFKCKFKFK